MKRTPVVVAIVVAVVLASTGAWLIYRSTDRETNPQTAAQTTFPDLTPAAGAPTLASLADLHPEPGTVVEASGPFDDRFHFQRLSFDGTTVTGTTTITSDVSEVLELEAVAGFYDRNGALVGTARDVYHLDESAHQPADEGVPEESYPFSITVPGELRGRAVAAAVGVPILVNE